MRKKKKKKKKKNTKNKQTTTYLKGVMWVVFLMRETPKCVLLRGVRLRINLINKVERVNVVIGNAIAYNHMGQM